MRCHHQAVSVADHNGGVVHHVEFIPILGRFPLRKLDRPFKQIPKIDPVNPQFGQNIPIPILQIDDAVGTVGIIEQGAVAVSKADGAGGSW